MDLFLPQTSPRCYDIRNNRATCDLPILIKQTDLGLEEEEKTIRNPTKIFHPFFFFFRITCVRFFWGARLVAKILPCYRARICPTRWLAWSAKVLHQTAPPPRVLATAFLHTHPICFPPLARILSRGVQANSSLVARRDGLTNNDFRATLPSSQPYTTVIPNCGRFKKRNTFHWPYQ